ncbi:MAG: hypothetical protein JW855_02155 [Gammaproteobacteria bacterium]|nr:hypothetical protein [Gammaproteobacteria bacterium]
MFDSELLKSQEEQPQTPSKEPSNSNPSLNIDEFFTPPPPDSLTDINEFSTPPPPPLEGFTTPIQTTKPGYDPQSFDGELSDLELDPQQLEQENIFDSDEEIQPNGGETSQQEEIKKLRHLLAQQQQEMQKREWELNQRAREIEKTVRENLAQELNIVEQNLVGQYEQQFQAKLRKQTAPLNKELRQLQQQNERLRKKLEIQNKQLQAMRLERQGQRGGRTSIRPNQEALQQELERQKKSVAQLRNLIKKKNTEIEALKINQQDASELEAQVEKLLQDLQGQQSNLEQIQEQYSLLLRENERLQQVLSRAIPFETVENLTQRYEEQIRQLNIAFQSDLEEQKRLLNERYTNTLEEQLVQLRSQLAEFLRAKEATNQQAIDDLQGKHARELEELSTQNSSRAEDERENIIKRHEEQMQKLREEQAQAMEIYRKQLQEKQTTKRAKIEEQIRRELDENYRKMMEEANESHRKTLNALEVQLAEAKRLREEAEEQRQRAEEVHQKLEAKLQEQQIQTRQREEELANLQRKLREAESTLAEKGQGINELQSRIENLEKSRQDTQNTSEEERQEAQSQIQDLNQQLIGLKQAQTEDRESIQQLQSQIEQRAQEVENYQKAISLQEAALQQQKEQAREREEELLQKIEGDRIRKEAQAKRIRQIIEQARSNQRSLRETMSQIIISVLGEIKEMLITRQVLTREFKALLKKTNRDIASYATTRVLESVSDSSMQLTSVEAMIANLMVFYGGLSGFLTEQEDVLEEVRNQLSTLCEELLSILERIKIKPNQDGQREHLNKMVNKLGDFFSKLTGKELALTQPPALSMRKQFGEQFTIFFDRLRRSIVDIGGEASFQVDTPINSLLLAIIATKQDQGVFAYRRVLKPGSTLTQSDQEDPSLYVTTPFMQRGAIENMLTRLGLFINKLKRFDSIEGDLKLYKCIDLICEQLLVFLKRLPDFFSQINPEEQTGSLNLSEIKLTIQRFSLKLKKHLLKKEKKLLKCLNVRFSNGENISEYGEILGCHEITLEELNTRLNAVEDKIRALQQPEQGVLLSETSLAFFSEEQKKEMNDEMKTFWKRPYNPNGHIVNLTQCLLQGVESEDLHAKLRELNALISIGIDREEDYFRFKRFQQLWEDEEVQAWYNQKVIETVPGMDESLVHQI